MSNLCAGRNCRTGTRLSGPALPGQRCRPPTQPRRRPGQNTGIQDGYALGRAFTTGTLDGYETHRRPVAERVVAFTDRMTRVATTRSSTARTLQNTRLCLLGHTGFPNKLATEFAELNYR
ncbi:FAD-dependent oxidoreductase [Streptomyces mirabilis]|uniref:FAD-dependent oxidoreductase n=1 Tax=Streptomyces mirabilis TaxID=68239 RepID=UPI0036C0649C